MVPKFPQGWWEQLPWPWGTSCSFPSPGKPTAGTPCYGKHEQFILVPKLKSLFLNWSSQFLQEGNLGLAPCPRGCAGAGLCPRNTAQTENQTHLRFPVLEAPGQQEEQDPGPPALPQP